MASSKLDDLVRASPLPLIGSKRMELEESSPELHSCGELLERGGHSARDPSHQVLDVHEPVFPHVSVPFTLSFKNLTYSVNVSRNVIPACFRGTNRGSTRAMASSTDQKSCVKVLLNDISGEAREGEIMAILGASGSGKSTLIDALAGRISRESLKGTIALNGEALESKLIKLISAYVMQDDMLFPMLTVEETLMFAAEFRLPGTMAKSKKKARVQALIDQLGLRSAAKTVIGDEGHRGVSGGERRRVSIGTDIIHDPILLFLDEPTSGLDSTSAYMVVKVLQRIAQTGSIVIMSVHQPSYRILSLLDRLIILSCGHLVFGGPPRMIPEFFAEYGNPIPADVDRTEFALDCIRDLQDKPGGTLSLVEFNKTWQKKINPPQSSKQDGRPTHSLKEAIRASVSRGKLVSGSTDMDANLSSSVPKYANSFWREMVVIAKRSLTNSRRAPESFRARFIAVLFTGFILASFFRKLPKSPDGFRERLGFFAFAVGTTFYACAEALPKFIQERYIFLRETSYNAYRRSSYVISHSIISIPSMIILSLTFSVITYFFLGLAGGPSRFFIYLAFMIACFWAGSSMVTFISGTGIDLMTGYTILAAVVAYFLLFSGFFLTRDRMPRYWIWFHYLSLVKYPYQGVMQNEFDDPSACFVRGIQIFDGSKLAKLSDDLKLNLLESISKSYGQNITGSTCFTTGRDILEQAGVEDVDKWACLWITIALGFFFRILFYFALLFGSKNKRR